jgi:hypothetical protein
MDAHYHGAKNILGQQTSALVANCFDFNISDVLTPFYHKKWITARCYTTVQIKSGAAFFNLLKPSGNFTYHQV